MAPVGLAPPSPRTPTRPSRAHLPILQGMLISVAPTPGRSVFTWPSCRVFDLHGLDLVDIIATTGRSFALMSGLMRSSALRLHAERS